MALCPRGSCQRHTARQNRNLSRCGRPSLRLPTSLEPVEGHEHVAFSDHSRLSKTYFPKDLTRGLRLHIDHCTNTSLEARGQKHTGREFMCAQTGNRCALHCSTPYEISSHISPTIPELLLLFDMVQGSVVQSYHAPATMTWKNQTLTIKLTDSATKLTCL